jgi:zinc transporter 2
MEMKKANKTAQSQLYMASAVSLFFIVAQLIGGYMAGSIAILTDSAHLASDLIGFALSIASLKIAEKKADEKNSFGYHRAEIIGSVVSLSSIWIMTIFLVMAAFQRFFMPPQVNSNLMLPISIMGLVFNLIQMKILHQDEPETIQDQMAADRVNDESLKESMLNDGQAVKSSS